MGWLTITVATQYVCCSIALATAILAVQFVPGYLLWNSFHFIFEYVNIVFPRVYSGAGVVTRVSDSVFTWLWSCLHSRRYLDEFH